MLLRSVMVGYLVKVVLSVIIAVGFVLFCEYAVGWVRGKEVDLGSKVRALLHGLIKSRPRLVLMLSILIRCLLYGVCCLTILGVWSKDIDPRLTLRALLRSLLPSEVSDTLQEKARLTIQMEEIGPTFDPFQQQRLTVENSRIPGQRQYRILVRNDSSVELQNIDLTCQFPFSVVSRQVMSQVGVVDGIFAPHSHPLTVSGTGCVEMSRTPLTPVYDLKIGRLNPEGCLELIATLDISRDIWRRLEGPKHNYIFGKYFRKLDGGNEELNIYCPIETRPDKSLRLGEPLPMIPEGLVERFDVDF
jgi:hypothetical protein